MSEPTRDELVAHNTALRVAIEKLNAEYIRLLKEHLFQLNRADRLRDKVSDLHHDIVHILQTWTKRQRYKLKQSVSFDQKELDKVRRYLFPEYAVGHGKKKKTA
jgi:hypothetical protein